MAKTDKFIKVHKRHLLVAAVALTIILAPLVVVAIILGQFYQRIYPGITINNISLAGKTKVEARELITKNAPLPVSLDLTIQTINGIKNTRVSIETLHPTSKVDQAVDEAYNVGRSGNLFADLGDILLSAHNKLNLPVSIDLDEQSVSDYISNLSNDILSIPVYPSITLKNGDPIIVSGTDGEELPESYVEDQIIAALNQNKNVVTLTTKRVQTTLTDAEASIALERAQKILDKELVLTIDGQEADRLKANRILPFLNPLGAYRNSEINQYSEDLARQFNREVVEPIFNFENDRVKEFSAGANGVAVETGKLSSEIASVLSTLEISSETSKQLEVAHKSVLPQTHVKDVNNLGIKELLGRGTSKFAGSIPSRVFNVALAASRINGVLVPPGETFSFAKAIGDISKFTGYKEAYIIQNGRTILGDGGGVCQVSTTLFRAVMNAGLPIVERHAHAYRVGYYEQDGGPGIDATVFVPSVDFKFKNDTGHYVLVQTKVDTKKLTAEFSIYGTSDGRVSTVTKPIVTDQIAPAEDLYIDDPTLPLGKINQVEHKAWGAKVRFDYTVTKGSETLFQKTFVSTYAPWKAVFMRGTGPAQ